MTTLHDVIRTLIRGGAAFRDEANQQRALLAVDAHEQGFPDAETYSEELKARAAQANREAGSPESPEEELARLRAENTRLQGQVSAAAPRTPDA